MTREVFYEISKKNNLFWHKPTQGVYGIMQVSGMIQREGVWEPCVHYRHWFLHLGTAGTEVFYRPLSEFLEKFEPFIEQGGTYE